VSKNNEHQTQPDPNVGRRLIDQYVLVEKIGEGGMGAVYLAEQPTVGRRAVVKLLHPQLSRDPNVAARFNLEARAAAALNHPHIVTVYNYGADSSRPDGGLFLAMEYLEGRDLERAVIDAGRLAAARAVHIARQVCAALAEAHARGVVHRDLKPSNVMLVTRGRDDDFVKVLDFGIAKVKGVALTNSNMVFGTPEYMSPEQLRGQELDGRSDLYAVGVVLFEMLAGRLPFVCETPEQLMTSHLESLPPPLSQAAPGVEVPAELEALVARCLAKDRAARPASAEELAELLAATIEGAPSTAVGGKKSDPPRRGRALAPGGEATLRAALIGGIVACVVLIALVVVVRHRNNVQLPSQPQAHSPIATPAQTAPTPTVTPPTPTPTPTPAAPPAPAPTPAPSEATDDNRNVEDLEREFLEMKSSLKPRDRRAALRALHARIDASAGSAAERARKLHDALIELTRQHAN
jgi:serine/threonine protein kinase